MKNFFDFEDEIHQINNLPNAETANQEKNSVIVITLDLKDRIFVDEKLLEIGLIKNEILSKIKNTKNRKVIIRADKDVKYGKVISILDILRKLDGIKIGVSTES